MCMYFNVCSRMFIRTVAVQISEAPPSPTPSNSMLYEVGGLGLMKVCMEGRIVSNTVRHYGCIFGLTVTSCIRLQVA